MIVLALSILIYDNRKITTRINSVEWAIFVIGSLIIVIGFSWDYAIYLIENNCFSDFWSLSDNAALFKTADEYVPQKFNWFLFILGEIILLLGITKYRTKLKRLMLQ